MILENQLSVPAGPDEVFALINDVERVAGCLPGATLDGRQDDAYLGRVKVKVGPITAAYSGTVRFTDVTEADRSLRLLARGADAHGNGDAEADVTLTVREAPGGATIELRTDLSIRGKLAQFGKGAIGAVSTRLLDQFARNLADQLRAGPVAATSAAPGPEAVDGLAMVLPEGVKRYGVIAAAAALGLFQGWLLGRIRTQDKLIKELQRGRR
ncbi:SRPBCC family protein [Amycolatopsis keratiniphila]|uniref:SRPBCC family protein n=1 Tax=Amycolatopsis keratiniphila TaxID=129921 RepID=UPI00087C856D|nr:SRPBCC family protein [Amycolatopsis keratiniphila]OLZ52776.1 carbon monoxide dehydrogenase [Amycolatopsis keratiniphila subsp. nogabecina]SDU08858.1 Carbon monoxide dehydrogenase subunit G [Amycolatopsis keratiniphila]